MEELVVGGAHFVAALSANRCADLIATPGERFHPLEAVPGTRVFDSSKNVVGQNRAGLSSSTVIVFSLNNCKA